MTTSEPTTCKAWKENTTGLRKDVWDQFDSKKDADLNRCKICGHEYFSDDNWDSIDPHTVEYAEHLNHHTRLILELKEKYRALEEERDALRAFLKEALNQYRFVMRRVEELKSPPIPRPNRMPLSLGLTADTIDVMAGLIVERDAKDAEIAELRAIVHEETLWLTEYHTRPLPGSDETCPACLLVSRAATALARHAQDGLAPIPPSDRRGEGK